MSTLLGGDQFLKIMRASSVFYSISLIYCNLVVASSPSPIRGLFIGMPGHAFLFGLKPFRPIRAITGLWDIVQGLTVVLGEVDVARAKLEP